MPIQTALVVDDSKSARIMLSRMLQKLDLVVSMVESGEEAITFLANNPSPDTIFMDHMMPGMDGVEATRIISESPGTSQIPIFMYTSKEGPEYENLAVEAGANGLLGKPAKLERLNEIINELNAANLSTDPNDTTKTTPAPESSPNVSAPLIAETEAVKSKITNNNVASEEEKIMSKEFVEDIARPLVTEALEQAISPLNATIQDLKTNQSEDQSEIRKLVSRQASNINVVTQPVLDASIKQTSVQFQNQLTNELKTIRELIERSTELSPADLQQIKELAIKSGAIAGAEQAGKTATSAAEAVAAKVSAAQAQIQLQQDMVPLIKKAKTANMVSSLSLIVAISAIVFSLI